MHEADPDELFPLGTSMLQTMLEASSTAVPLSLKTDTQYSEVTDVSGLSGVRGERRRV